MENKETKKDVVVTPEMVQLNGTDGLEGNRSTCCYAPAKGIMTRPIGAEAYACTKCEKPCDLLTEEEKLKINTKTKEAITQMMSEEVTVTVIHKTTEKNVSHKVKLPQVRVFAEQAVKQFMVGNPEARVRDFIVVEHYHKTGATKVTSLEK